MLPILDFNYLDDNDLIKVEELIQAINSISSVKINCRIIEALNKKSIIKIESDLFNHGCSIQDSINRALGYPEEPPTIRISKSDALKVLTLVKKQEKEWEEKRIEAASKPTKELATTKIKPPEVEREGKAYRFIDACFHSYKGKPSSLDELIRYCEERGAKGYTEIKIDGTDKRSRKVKCNEHKEGITWASLKKVYELFLKEQD